MQNRIKPDVFLSDRELSSCNHEKTKEIHENAKGADVRAQCGMHFTAGAYLAPEDGKEIFTVVPTPLTLVISIVPPI
jgi:hypothetical protein